jgi:hypothetical protein
MILTHFKHPLSSYLKLLGLMMLLILLTACSPHSGAGQWQAEGKNNLNVDHINIVFEGTADFFNASHQDSILRCFWSASGKNSLKMQCVHADDTHKKEIYDFIINETEQGLFKAKLIQNEQLIGLFSRHSST